jgi:hypothetical protein
MSSFGRCKISILAIEQLIIPLLQADCKFHILTNLII